MTGNGETPDPTAIGPGDNTCYQCKTRKATACTECMRALALRNFWTISRHPESLKRGQEPCKMCQAGVPALCGVCFIEDTATYREELRDGHQILDWGDPIDHFGQRGTGRQLYTSGKKIREKADQAENPEVRAALTEVSEELIEFGLGLADPFGGV